MVTSLPPDVSFDIAASVICATLIFTRCAYRIVFPCKQHPTCHRRWRVDDAYMLFALLPLIARTATITYSFMLNPSHAREPATPEDAVDAGKSMDELNDDRELSKKLLLPARISYALFLWTLKLCLLTFYARFVNPLNWGRMAITALWWIVVLTFAAVLIATLTECRPLSRAWEIVPADQRHECGRGMANLMTMAIFNIITDLALIILPFPILRSVRLDRKHKFQLAVLFGIGAVVVAITIVRIPLILLDSVSQRSRSMWASIEILCACIVANAAFFYTIVKDFQTRSHSHSSNNANSSSRNFYMQSLQSSSRCGEDQDAQRPSSKSAVMQHTAQVEEIYMTP